MEQQAVDKYDLLGEHILDAVEIAAVPGEANSLAIRLDGDVYVFLEDESDGYRSYLGSVLKNPDGLQLSNVFPPLAVTVARSDLMHMDTLQLVSTLYPSHGWILEVGTNNSDDYYPSCVSDFRPDVLTQVLEVVAVRSRSGLEEGKIRSANFRKAIRAAHTNSVRQSAVVAGPGPDRRALLRKR